MESVLISLLFSEVAEIARVAITYTNRTIFCSKSHLFPCEWRRNTETKQPVKFQRFFKVTNEIYGKVNFAAFVPKSLINLFIENEKRW